MRRTSTTGSAAFDTDRVRNLGLASDLFYPPFGLYTPCPQSVYWWGGDLAIADMRRYA